MIGWLRGGSTYNKPMTFDRSPPLVRDYIVLNSLDCAARGNKVRRRCLNLCDRINLSYLPFLRDISPKYTLRREKESRVIVVFE